MKIKGILATVAAFCAAAFSPAHADWTVDANTKLTEDVTVSGTLTVAAGATLDLNGYSLTAGAVVGSGSIVDSLAAAGYERLEYLEAKQTEAKNGSAPSNAKAQFIDTGYKHNAKTDVDIRVAYTALSSYQVVYGARSGGGDAVQFGVWLNGSKFMKGTCTGSASTPSDNSTAAAVDKVYDIRISKSGANTVTSPEDPTINYNLTNGNGNNSNSAGNDYLFCINQTGSSTTYGSWTCRCKVWFCKISEEGVLKRDFVPVRFKSGATYKYGMLDQANDNTFYTKKTDESEEFEGPVAAHGLRLTPSAAGAASDFSGLTIGEDVSLSFAGAGKLPANLDATKFASVEIAKGAALDLAGHRLAVKGVSATDTSATGANIVSNPSFEQGFTPGGWQAWSDSSHPTGWTMTDGSVGSSKKNQPWVADVAIDGTYACYLQTGGTIQQNFDIEEAGYYEVSLMYASRRDQGYSGGIVTLSINGTTCYTDALLRSDTAVRTGTALVWLDAGTSIPLVVSHAFNPADSNTDQAIWVDAISVKRVSGFVDTSSGAAGELRIETADAAVIAAALPPAYGAVKTVFALTDDADWTAAGAVNIPAGAALDLNGHSLVVAGLTGGGIVTDNSNNYYTTLKDASGNFYIQLEYLASGTSTDQYNHGMEYIDTGYQHNTKTVVDMKVQILKGTTDWYCYYGARNGTANALGGWINRDNHYKGVTADTGTSIPYPKNVPYLVHMEFGGTCTFGNASDTATYLTYTSGEGGSSGINDFMFGMNNGGSVSHRLNGRIYYCTVKEKTDEAGVYTVQRDFVAAKRLSDGVLGMLDKENGVFYTNKGSGAFIAGDCTVNADAAAFGSSGMLRIAVPAETTLALDDMPKIVGDVKVVKEGVGTLTYDEATSTQKYFLGGYEIHSDPAVAVWTGTAEDGNFDNAANWMCCNDLGGALPGIAPNATTTTYRLGADADWTAKGAIALGAGVVLDLAGHNLTATSITGAGTVTDSAGTALSGYDRLEYLQAEQKNAGNLYAARNSIQYIDTGYKHNGTTKVEMRVVFTQTSYGVESSVHSADNYATYYGARKTPAAYAFAGWLVGGKIGKNGTSSSDVSAGTVDAAVGTVYDIVLDKAGTSTMAWEGGSYDFATGNGGTDGDGTPDYNGRELTDFIFALNQPDTYIPNWPIRMKCYSCKIYDKKDANGNTVSDYILKRDFVPVRRKADNALGMLDLVEGKFYGNAGGGSFTAPESVVSTTRGGELHIVVAEGATASLADMAKITGSVKVVKDGLGTLTLPASGTCFVGGLEVAGGTLSMTQTPVNLLKTPVTASAGGTIAIAAADGASYANNFSLAGGTLKALASGSGATTTATIAGTLALVLGANDAQPSVSVDMTDCSGTAFILNTTALTVGAGVTAAPGFVAALPVPADYETSVVDGTAIKVERLTTPVTAVWTGAGEPGNFDDPANWSCSNKNGDALPATTLPNGFTTAYRLGANADWTAKGAIAFGAGVTLDLAGYSLTATSITGDGVVLDSEYQLLEYIESAGAQVIDTTLKPDANTKIDAVFTLTKLDSKTIFGTQWGNNGFLAFCQNNTTFYALFNTAVSMVNNATFSTGTRYRLTVESGNVVIKNDDTGVTVGTASSVNMSGGGKTLSICCSVNSSGTSLYGYCKIHSFQIWQSDELLYDFVPAREIATGKIGLWNKVEGKMYASTSGTPFIAGPLVQGGTPNGELHVAVAAGATVSLGDMAEIAGTVKVVKEGAGTLTLPASGHWFTGGLEVAGGTLSMSQTPGWMTNATVSATAGGTIEVAAADGASYANNFTLAGGTLKALASGTGATTTAAIAGTLALELGANDAQPKVSVDMTDCSSTTFILNTTALTVGEGVTAAPGFVQTPDATFEASIVDGTAIQVERVTAPVTAAWTGEEDDNFDNAANWTCYNKNGAALPATTLPDSSTTTYRLGTDADWTAKGAIALGAGVILDLAGHNLTVESITGSGVVIDSSANFITASDGSVYQKIQYVQATQDGANNSGNGQSDGKPKIQYVDTEYYHVGTTKVDIRVEFQDVSYSGNYGYATYYGCRNNGDNATHQLGGWLHSGKFYYYDTSEHDGSTAYTGRIYDIRLDKGGSSYANYADGTLASTLGTGNGAGESNTYGTDYIFANNQVWNDGKYWPCKCRVYSCKVYTGDTPERDFVPVRRVSGTNPGEAGFWCNVTKKFYGNSGYGSLTAGPAVQSATAGVLHISVPADATLSLANMAAIAGNVKVAKIGVGTLTLPATGHWFSGGIEVQAGTLSMAQTPGWMTNATVSAAAGGTIAIAAADGASYANNFTLAGGTLKALASGSGATTTATIAGTLALALGANDAQPSVSVDMTSCSSGTFTLNTTALTAGTGVTAAPGFVEIPDATMFEASVVDGTAIKVERLTTPVTAVWTGAGEPGNFNDPANWSCSNKHGIALPNTTVPALDGSTLAFSLGADADWTDAGAVTLGAGVVLDLAGRTLTATSITGSGVVIDSSANFITASDGSVYQKIQYVQATQDGANNDAGLGKIQYVDTEYYHVGTTKVDIRVEFQDVSYSGNYGYATYYGCRNNGGDTTHQLGGWLRDSKFYYYDTEMHYGSDVYINRIYDIRLDKGGSSYANYADGTLASTLGTGNGAGESNTYGTDYIFANNQVWNNGKYWPCKCRVYSCKVYTGDTLERDFVPVRRVSGTNPGEAGFWCNVTKKFYGNSGYGSLTAGPAVQSATAGVLHIGVPADATVSLANTPTIAGNVKIVKDGLGTLVAPMTGHYFTGGIEVTAGALSMGGALAYGGAISAASGTTVSVPASVGTAGTSAVSIAGGTLEVVNCGTSAVNGTVTLSGGAITVSGSFAPVSGTAAHSITLADGTTLDFTQWTGAFPVAYPSLAYAAGANIAVRLEPRTEAIKALGKSFNATTGNPNGYLLQWSAAPSGVTFGLDSASSAKFVITPDENGLQVTYKAGFTIIVL